MNLDQVAQSVRAFIQQEFNIPSSDADFTDDVHLFNYGYIDSFGAAALKSFVEDTFAIKVSQSDLIGYPMNTVNEIAGFVVKRQAGEI